MTDGWKKLERIQHGLYIVDELDGAHVKDGTLFKVRFPSGTIMQLPAMLKRLTLVSDASPFVEVRDQVFFFVEHEELPEVWVRALDVEVQPV